MNAEKKMKKTYEIVGRTASNKFVTVGFCDSVKVAITYFIQKYPRFRGRAEIRAQMAEDMGNGVLCADYGKWETVGSFESAREVAGGLDWALKEQEKGKMNLPNPS